MDSSIRIPIKDSSLQIPQGEQRVRRNALSDSSSSIKNAAIAVARAAEEAGVAKIKNSPTATVNHFKRGMITANSDKKEFIGKNKLNVMTKEVKQESVNRLSGNISVKDVKNHVLKGKIVEKKDELQEKMAIRERLSSINSNTQKYNKLKLEDCGHLMSVKGEDKGKLQQINKLLNDYKDTFGLLWDDTTNQQSIKSDLGNLGFSESLTSEDLIDAKIKVNNLKLAHIDHDIKEIAMSCKSTLAKSANSENELTEFDNEIKMLEQEIKGLEDEMISQEALTKQEAPAIIQDSEKVVIRSENKKTELHTVDQDGAKGQTSEITHEEAQNAKMMRTAQFVQSLTEDRLDQYMSLNKNDREIFQALDEMGNKHKENESFVEMLLQGLSDKSSKLAFDNGKIFIDSSGGKANFLTSSGNIAGSSEIPKRLEIAVEPNGKLTFSNAEELSKILKLSLFINSLDAKEIELFSKLTKSEKEVFQKLAELGKGDKANRLFTDMIFLGLKGKSPRLDLVKEGPKSYMVINSKGAKGVYQGVVNVSCHIPPKIKIEIDENGKFVLPKESLNLEVGWFKYNIGVKAGDDGRLSFDSNIKVFGFQEKIDGALKKGHGLNTIFKGFGEELKWL